MNAIGIHNEKELRAIAQDVPALVRRDDCSTCLWASCECKRGSMYEPNPGAKGREVKCKAWSYYD